MFVRSLAVVVAFLLIFIFAMRGNYYMVGQCK